MNPAIATVVVSVVGVVGVIVGAVVSAWLNKDKDDATVADQVSKAWAPLVAELRTDVAEAKKEAHESKQEAAESRRECGDCRRELGKVKKALRSTVRMLDMLPASNDPAMEEARIAAVSAARELM